MIFLVTGSAGFIGMSTSQALLKKKHTVIGIDSLNSYYDIKLKKDRNKELLKFKKFKFINLDLSKDYNKIEKVIKKFKIKNILHFAAQANVRYSLKNPKAYINNNIIGFYNMLEVSKKNKIKNFIYASSSSVYGNNYKNIKIFDEKLNTDSPKNLYAATKKCNEVLAHAYADIFKFNVIGLRFFTVYGPWGRPDMAPFLFIDAILKRKKINVFNAGNMSRDFTYIDDVVSAILKITFKSIKSKNRIIKLLNIGRGNGVNLLKFISYLEEILKKDAYKKFLPLQTGDMVSTKSNIKQLKKFIGYSPKTNLKQGLINLCKWYLEYYK